MHEMSIAESLLDLIRDSARSDGFSRVTRVGVQLGAVGHVEPEALAFCFDVVTRGTVAEGARLEIEVVPASGRCPGCGRVVRIEQRYDLCPSCGSHVDLQTGDELRLMELGVE